MLFNSLEFLAFFAVVLAVLPRLGLRLQNRFLLLASLIFYGSWNWRFLGLLLGTSMVDFIVGLRIGRAMSPGRRKAWLAVSITVNLAVLAYFKYANFFISSTASALDLLGIQVSAPMLSIVLPAGISFFLFQSMSYAIDVYRSETPIIRRLSDYLLYTSYFPNMLAGPIERPGHLSAQLLAPRFVSPGLAWGGLWLFGWGLLKKVVVADNLAVYVDSVYRNSAEHSGVTLLLATYLFAFQIYCDFSGYSDMAIGMARMMGVNLVTNFRTPYFALSVQDFWRRWHISLSTWFRDYVYLPLGGNRGSRSRTMLNTLSVFLISGLWHGANWTFVIWGGLHGVYLIIERLFSGQRTVGEGSVSVIGRVMRVVLTFNLVCLAWVFFRAPTVGEAIHILRAFIQRPGTLFWDSSLVPGLVGVAAMLSVELWLGRVSIDERVSSWSTGRQIAAATGLLVLLAMLGAKSGGQFIYFQF